mgnify:CR=1 FL=1
MRDWISPGTHINAFGADGHGKQELDHNLIINSKIVVDSLNQCKIGGEIELPIKNGLITDSDVHASLGDIINGDKSVVDLILNKSDNLFLKKKSDFFLVYQRL